MSTKPVIAIAGLACETSTFTPSRTSAAAFHPLRGPEIISRYKFLHPYTALGSSATWTGILDGHALPGGAVTRTAFETLSSEIITRLQDLTSSQKIDGLWFDIHGAMCVEGLDDVESLLLQRIRQVIGKGVVVSASMDLHGNVSRELAHQTDLITCYRMAPHEDAMETKERACRNLVDVLTKTPRGDDGRVALPIKAWIPIPILLPGEQTSTRDEPAKRIYAAVSEVEKEEGVLDAAIWVGYAWADEPRDRAVVMVTGWDRDKVTKGAEKLAKLFWDAREEFHFVAPTGSYDECIDKALTSKVHPFFISDSGDNPTAGGSGDVTWGLTRLLERPEFRDDNESSSSSSRSKTVIYASVPGPEAIRKCVEASVGATVTVTAGAEVDDIHAGPITMTGRVHSIKHGDRDAVTEVVLEVGGNNKVFAILTEFRKPYHHEHDFTDLSLKPREADIVIVKIGYLEPELYDMAADWMLALTPGGVDQDLERLGHRRILRPMWPFDKEFKEQPDLSARVIPFSYEPLNNGNKSWVETLTSLVRNVVGG